MQVPLVEQHYSEEFSPFLKPIYKVERVSGNSQLKISFTEIVKNNDVIICTAQILENYLERSVTGEDEGVHLSGKIYVLYCLQFLPIALTHFIQSKSPFANQTVAHIQHIFSGFLDLF